MRRGIQNWWKESYNMMNCNKKLTNENIPVEKLSIQQLKILCMQKKRDGDTVCVSKMKRSELVGTRIAWKDWPDDTTDDIVEVVDAKVLQQENSQQINIDCDPAVVEDHDNIIMILHGRNFSERWK